MNDESRVKKSIRNSVYGILSYVSILLVTFVSRKIFANSLGAEFLGLNSLFASIMDFLNLTELGLSTAILYFLYNPVAKKDIETIKTYLRYYKKIFVCIALIILTLGIIICFFIDDFAKTSVLPGQLRLYFILYLCSTIASYLNVYKTSLLYADQKNSVISKYHALSKNGFAILQMILLVVTKNYILYLILQIFSNFLENFLCSKYVDKQYPFVKDHDYRRITKAEKKEIYMRIKGISIQKFSFFIVSSTGTIILSTFINVVQVGIYSNYVLISSTLKSVFGQIFSAFTTSFGNLTATEGKEKSYLVYKNAKFFSDIFIYISATVYFSLIQSFMLLWMGSDYLFPISTAFVIVILYYVSLMYIPEYSIQNALALHNIDKNIILFQAFLNLVLSLIFVQIMGVFGIILSTIISEILPATSKIYVVYNKVFNKSISIYFKDYAKKFIVFIFTIIITYYLTNSIFVINVFISFIIKMFIAFSIPIAITFILYRNTEEFNYFIVLLKRILKRNI